jgi:AcrR family transcriptional regulator
MAPNRSAVRRRTPLTRDRVLRAALRIADRDGIDSVSMRKLGQALRVEAMSLYKHVADKEDVLDGLADLVISEVELPPDHLGWKPALRHIAISVHEALLRHPWAAAVLDSRLSPGPARLRYLDTVIGILRRAGFSLPDVARAFMALDSHIYGFTLQETNIPFAIEDAPQAAAQVAAHAGTDYPNLQAIALLAATEPESFPVEFEFGLDILLDGLERRRPRASSGSRPS